MDKALLSAKYTFSYYTAPDPQAQERTWSSLKNTPGQRPETTSWIQGKKWDGAGNGAVCEVCKQEYQREEQNLYTGTDAAFQDQE